MVRRIILFCLLATFAYGVSATGQRTSCAETVNGASRTYAWQYDLLNRLTSEVMGGALNGSAGYQFDAVGNRLQRTGSMLPAQTMAYDANDRLLADTFDNNGNTLNS